MARELSTDVELSFLPPDYPGAFAGISVVFFRDYGEGRFPELSLRIVPIDRRNPLRIMEEGYQWFAELNETGRTCLANAVFRGYPERAMNIYESAKSKLIKVYGFEKPIPKDFFESVIKH